MTAPLDLDQVQARSDAATEGPWAWEATGEKDNSWAVGQIQDDDGNPIEGENEPGENIVIEGVCEGIDANLGDAEFIAHARQDIPALVAELRAARPIIEAARRHECSAAYQTTVWNLIVAYDEVAEGGGTP